MLLLWPVLIYSFCPDERGAYMVILLISFSFKRLKFSAAFSFERDGKEVVPYMLVQLQRFFSGHIFLHMLTFT